MTLRRALIAAWLLAALPHAGAAAVRLPQTTPRHPGAMARAHVVARGHGPARSNGPARARAGATTRTLEDIHIEGEIPVPQVLFITARDQRRYLEFQHGRYLKSSRRIGEETDLPSWIVVTGTRPAENRGSSR